MSGLRLYRVDILGWPTPDGQPFDRQSDGFWRRAVDAYANPSEAKDYPEWLPDIGDWMDSDDNYGLLHVQPGCYFKEAGLTVPTLSRRHWIARHAAKRRADLFAEWGCEVSLVASDPITWHEATA